MVSADEWIKRHVTVDLFINPFYYLILMLISGILEFLFRRFFSISGIRPVSVSDGKCFCDTQCPLPTTTKIQFNNFLKNILVNCVVVETPISY